MLGSDTTLLSETGQMDRLTQTQDSLDELIKIMYSSLGYLTKKANFQQVNPSFPVTQVIPNAEPPEAFKGQSVPRSLLVGG